MTELVFDISYQNKNFVLKMKSGEISGITGVYGRSGSGKTTLIKLLCGLLTPDAGEIVMGGRILFSSDKKIDLPPQKRRFGVVFQENRLFPHLTVEDNLRYGMRFSEKKKFEYNKIVELLELGSLLKRYPEQLSGGEARRTAVGRALLTSPEFLLMDEPTASMDMKTRNQIVSYLKKTLWELKISAIYVSHDLAELLSLCRELYLVRNGTFADSGEYGQLIHRNLPKDVISRDCLINLLNVRVLKNDLEQGITKVTVSGSRERLELSMQFIGFPEQKEFDVIIRSSDIAIASEEISEISIQNRFTAVVTRVTRNGMITIVELDAGSVVINAVVTPQAAKALDLKEGKMVWCLIKASAVVPCGMMGEE